MCDKNKTKLLNKQQKEKMFDDEHYLKFYYKFTKEELAEMPPLPEKHKGWEDNVVWNGEEWEYLPID